MAARRTLFDTGQASGEGAGPGASDYSVSQLSSIVRFAMPTRARPKGRSRRAHGALPRLALPLALAALFAGCTLNPGGQMISTPTPHAISGKVTDFAIPTAHSFPEGITL